MKIFCCQTVPSYRMLTLQRRYHEPKDLGKCIWQYLSSSNYSVLINLGSTAMFKEHNNMFKVPTRPLNSPDLSPVSMCVKCWTNKSDPGSPRLQLTERKGCAANASVPDTTAHLQGSAGVHASAIVLNGSAFFSGVNSDPEHCLSAGSRKTHNIFWIYSDQFNDWWIDIKLPSIS